MSKRKKYQTSGILDYDVWSKEFDAQYAGQVSPGAALDTTTSTLYNPESDINFLDVILDSEENPEQAARESQQSFSTSYSPTHGTYVRVPDFESYQAYIDRPFSFVSDDPDDMRAHSQTFGEKALFGVPKLITRTGTNILGSTVGLVYGGFNWLNNLANPETSAWKSFWDNDFQRSLDGINEWMDEKLPHYYSKEEQQYNFWRSMGTANFWFNDFTQGASFVMGAVLSEALMRGLGSSAAVTKANQLLRSPFKWGYEKVGITKQKRMDTFMKEVVKPKQLGNVAIRLRQLGTGAMYEAGVEARHNYDRTLEHLVQLFKDEHDNEDPNVQQMADLVDLATKTANAVWAGNTLLVGYGNYIMFPKIFGAGYYGTRSALRGRIKTQKTLPRGSKRTYKNIRDDYGKIESVSRNIARILRVPLYEGFVEEGGQKVLDFAGEHAAETFYLAKADPNYMQSIGEMMNSMDDVWAKSYGSTEGQKEIGIGFLLALLGVPGYTHSAKEGKGGWSWVGGAMQRRQEHLNDENQVDKLLKIFKKHPHLWDATEANFNALNRAEVLQDIQDAGLVMNSKYSFTNAEDNALLNLIVKKLQTGVDFTLYEDIEMIRNMRLDKFKEVFNWLNLTNKTDDQIKAIRNKTADQFADKIEEVREIYKIASDTFTNFGDDQLLTVVEAMATSKRADERRESMKAKARELINKNNKGVPLELEVEVENVSERNKQEQLSLTDRLRNIWARMTSSQKSKINKSPEGKKTKEKLGIDEFTKASHIEEVMITINEDLEKLTKKITDTEADPKLSKKQKEKKLKSIELEKEALLQRQVDLVKAIREGLDPDISSQEQEILDKWKAQDPAGYETHVEEVTQILKDLRLLRASEHRATDMLNYLKAEHNVALRENGTWSKIGKHLPRPEILLQRRIGPPSELSKDIKDKLLKRLYERHAGDFLEFKYTRTSDIQIGDYKKHAAENDLLKSVEAIALTKIAEGTITESEAWKQALEEKGIPYEEHSERTYRVFLKKDMGVTDNSKVVIIYPNKQTIALLRQKELLERVIDKDPNNKVAKDELEEITYRLAAIGTKPDSRQLSWLKTVASSIQRIDRNVIIKEQLELILDSTEEDLVGKINEFHTETGKYEQQIKEITALIKLYRTANKDWKKAAKTNKGELYIKVPGVRGRGYTAKGLGLKIQELLDSISGMDLNIQAHNIKIARAEENLANFFQLKEILAEKGITEVADFGDTIQEYFGEQWKGDKLLLEQLKQSDLFINNPIIKGIWKDLDPAEDPQTELIDALTNIVVANRKPAEAEIAIIREAQIELHQRLETLKSAAALLAKQITFNKDGSFNKLKAKAEELTRSEYEAYMAEISEIEAAIQLLDSEKIIESFAGAETVLQQRVNRYKRHIQLQNTINDNFHGILTIINDLLGEKQDIVDYTLNPYTKEGEMTQKEFEDAVTEQSKNLKTKDKVPVYTNSLPIHKHRFKKTIGDHIKAINRKTELETKEASEALSLDEQRELKAMKAQLRFFYISQLMRFKKGNNEILTKNDYTFDQYGIAFIHRGMLIEENEGNLSKVWQSLIQEAEEEGKKITIDNFLFYDPKVGNYKDARSLSWKKKKVSKQEDEHILAVIINKETGAPLLENGLPVYTGLMTAETTTEVVNEKGETINITRGQKTDLVSASVKSHMVIRPGETTAKEAWEGEHIPTVKALAKDHAQFRQDILKLTEPMAVAISGKSHGLTHFPAIYEARYKAGETIVSHEERVKHIQLGISTDATGNKIQVGGREFSVKAGFAFIEHNDNIFNIFVDNLNGYYQTQVYNLLRLYARNHFNESIGLDNKNYPVTVTEDKTVQRLSEKTITQQLKDIIYFGYHTKERTEQEYKIYFENNRLIFGENSMELVELNDPETHDATHSALKAFLGTLYHQINGINIKQDYDARVIIANKNNPKWTKWNDKRKLAAKNGGWTKNELSNAIGNEVQRLYKLRGQWKNKNPEPGAMFQPYVEYIETLVKDDLTISTRTWANYTEFLLGQGKRNTPNFRELDEIPIKLKIRKNSSALQGELKYNDPQKLAVYLTFQGAKKISDLVKLQALKTQTTTTTTQPIQVGPQILPDSGIQVGNTYRFKAANGETIQFKVDAINNNRTLDISIQQQKINNQLVEVVYAPNGQMQAVSASVKQKLEGKNPAMLASGKVSFLWKLGPGAQMILIPTIGQQVGQSVPAGQQGQQGQQENPITFNIKSNKKGSKSMSVIDLQIRDDFEKMDFIKELVKFTTMVPRDSNGNLIFTVRRVENLLKGTSHGYWDGISEILLDVEGQRGAIYHETWHGIEDRLLTPEQIDQIREEVRNIKGKTSLFRGQTLDMKDLTDAQISEWMAEEFRHYVLNEGNYKIGSNVQKSLLRQFFEWVFKFLSNLNTSQDLFRKIHTGYYHKGIENFTLFAPKTGKAMSSSKVNPEAEIDLIESMTVELFHVLENKGTSISEVLQMSEQDLEFNLHAAYGSPAAWQESIANKSPVNDTVWAQMIVSLQESKQLLEDNKNIPNISSNAIEVLNNNIKDLDNIANALGNQGYWEKLKKRNLKNLRDIKLNVNIANVLDLENFENKEESEEITKDSVASLSPNKINPTKLLSPEIKILLKTLPVGNFSTNKAGTAALAKYGDVIKNLYKNLSNKSTFFHMWDALDKLAEEDATYQVLKERLGLKEYHENLDHMNDTQMSLLVAFFTGFNKASDEYVTQLVHKKGGRNFVNSNSNLIQNLITQQWKENFQNNLFRKGLGILNEAGVFILNFKSSLTIYGITQSLEEWLKAKKNKAQMLGLLQELGITFSNLEEVEELIASGRAEQIFMESVSRIFSEFSTLDNVINIFDEGSVHGRMKHLVTIETLTTRKAVSLQHPNVNGDLVYGITRKHYINKLADKLNVTDEEALRLLEFDNLKNSIWLDRIKEGSNLQIRIIEGVRNRNDKKGHDISKTIKANIANLHVNSILEGYVPLIITGNKKTSRALKVGEENLDITREQMSERLKNYFYDEVMTARAIKNGNKSKRIKGLTKNGAAKLQFFKYIPYLDTLGTRDINDARVTNDREKYLKRFENDLAFNAAMDAIIDKAINSTREALLKYGIVDLSSKGDILNRGIDNQILANIYNSLPSNIKDVINIPKALKSNLLHEEAAKHLFTQLAFIQMTGIFEQSKLVLGHMDLYNDLFKRTSLTVGTKDYPFADKHILKWMNTNMANRINESKLHTNRITTVTRQEVTQTSTYLKSYIKILEVLNRQDLLPAVTSAFSNMDLFDGGGFIHLDFYRRVLFLTNNWGPQQEAVYEKLANNEPLTLDDIGHLPPIKPQVFADIELDGLNLKKGDKFALYPVHPQLSKTLSSLDNNQRTTIDDIYEEMNRWGLDYMTFESSTKVGAIHNIKGFDPLLDNETRVFQPLINDKAFIHYNLEDFGIQVDPKFKFSKEVAAPTQGTSLLPSDIYSNGELNPLYRGKEFKPGMTFDQAVNYYHSLNSELIRKDVNSLASRLGFIEAGGTFKFVGKNKNNIRNEIITELKRRELPIHTQQAIMAIFEATDVTLINQIPEKNRIENILYAIVNNTVIRRKMTGDMSVIQSSVGYEIKLKNKKGIFATVDEIREEMATKGITLNPLKFYNKGLAQLPNESEEAFYERSSKAPTNAMEVYLPYQFKEFLGDTFVEGAILSKEALEILGYRIPTEGLNSIEFMIIKDFLPPQGGSRIIVPNEMVAKAGADFDIDKLTMFFPNVYYNAATNTIEKVKPITSIEELRNIDKNAYISAAVELFKRSLDTDGIVTFIKEFKRIGAEIAIENRETEYKKLDTQLQNLGFNTLSDEAIQSTAVLQNNLQSFIKDMLSHPLSFDQLISPVGAYEVKSIADNIQASKIEAGLVSGHIVRNENGSIKMITETNNLFDKLNIEGIIETAYQMWSTLGGTGIVASSITNYVKGQRAGLAVSPIIERGGLTVPVAFNFEGINSSQPISLSRVFDLDGKRISNSMRQYITSYVDGEKDPFIMFVNGGKSSAGVHMLLLRAGLPLETVLYFMSQPIISDYLEKVNLQKGIHTQMFGSLKELFREDEIQKAIISSYVAEELSNPVQLTSDLLKQTVAKTKESGKINSMDKTERALQIQIFRDFLNYKEIAEDLRKLQVITSYDTAKFKNGSEVINIMALHDLVATKNRFINWQNMIQGTFLQPLALIISQFGPGIMSELDFKYSISESFKTPIIDKMTEMAKVLLEKGETTDNILYLLEQFDNHVTAHALHQTSFPQKGWSQYMGDRVQSLFLGQNSLAKRIREIQTDEKNSLRLNGFIALLRPIISPYQSNQLYEYTIDKITLKDKQLTTEDLDVMASEFLELQNSNPDLAKDIMIYSLLKSGISFSPTSFFQALPGKEINKITKPVLGHAKVFINLDTYDINTVYENFLDNKWNDNKITRRLWHDNVPGWTEDSEFETTEDYGERVLIIKPHHAAKEGAVDKTKMLNFFYKRNENKERIEENKEENTTIKYYTYELHPAKGVRNEIIETHEGLSIHNANNEARPTEELQLSSKELESIKLGNKTLIARPLNKQLKSGKYDIVSSDATDKILVRLDRIGDFNIKKLKSKANFSKFGITKEKDILQVIATRLGYKTINEMNTSKAMSSFKKGWIKIFYDVTVITQQNAAQVGAVVNPSPMQQSSTTSMSELTKGSIINMHNTNTNLC